MVHTVVDPFLTAALRPDRLGRFTVARRMSSRNDGRPGPALPWARVGVDATGVPSSACSGGWSPPRRVLVLLLPWSGWLLAVSSSWRGLASLARPAFARLNKAKDGMASAPRPILQGRLRREASRRWTLPSPQRHQGTEGTTGRQVRCGFGTAQKSHERVPVRCTGPA